MRTPTRSALLVLLLTACGKEPLTEPAPSIDAPDEVPTASAFEQCTAAGGSPKSAFMVSNQHGPVTTITVSKSVVILGSADKSVKQWTIAGLSYQTPFTTDAGSVIAQLAHTSSNDVLGVDGAGVLHRWTLLDVASDETVAIGAQALAAVGVNANGSKAAVGQVGTPNLRVLDLGSSVTMSDPLTTALTGVTGFAFGSADLLIDAGQAANAPLIERRSVASPAAVAESWTDATLTGGVTGLALAADASTLVAVGDGFVATFAPGSLAVGPTKLTKLPEHHAVGVVLLSGKQHFVTVGSEGTLRVWDVATASLVKTLTIPTPIGIGADADGSKVYTSGPDGQLHGWSCSP